MTLKQQLHQHCRAQLSERRQTILQAIKTIEESMSQEGKSTAGDKHNTARANMQLERERLGGSLQLAERLLLQLDRVDPDGSGDPVRLGSLVQTSAGRFYLAVACDAMPYKDGRIYCMGPESPLAQAMIGKGAGQIYKINGRDFEILSVS